MTVLNLVSIFVFFRNTSVKIVVLIQYIVVTFWKIDTVIIFQHAARYLANQEWVKNDSLKTVENTAVMPCLIG